MVATRASNLSLVRFDGNDYSVPVRWAHREVVVKGDCESVRIYREDEPVAEHRRIWEKEQVCFDPVHYLALLERKPGALDFARPLEGLGAAGVLPASCAGGWKPITAARAPRNTSGCCACWRSTAVARLKAAVEAALELGCPRKELIGQYLYGEDREAAVFRLDGREHLKVVNVACTDPGDYRALLGGANGKEEVA